MKKNLTAVLTLVIAAGCGEANREPVAEAPELLGTWEETWMVVMDTTDPRSGMDFDAFVADSTNWEKKRRQKPTRTTYFPDGTFQGEYRDVRDSVFVVSHGTWAVKGESLYYHQETPDVYDATYWYFVSEDTLHLRGIVDWNRNGMRDDKYRGTQKKIK